MHTNDGSTAGLGSPATSTDSPPSLVHWFADVGRDDIAAVGGKGANLGELTRAGLPVPQGFIIGVDAYAHFREAAHLGPTLDATLASLDVDDPRALRDAAATLRRAVLEATLPDELSAPIVAAYRALGDSVGREDPMVAVRSSATAEDTGDHSFAGMFESFLNVRGADELLRRVRECWASTFHARVLFYRRKQGMPGEMPVAVVVQAMVDSEKSGVMFTADPATHDRSRIVIEAAWGLGEVIVLGQVEPDRDVLAKDSLAILERHAGHKDFLLVRGEDGGARRVSLEGDPRADAPVLTDDELRQLGELALRIEALYGHPQDVEFAIARGEVYLTQARPITTISPAVPSNGGAPGAILVRGLGASPGRASGVVRILDAPEEADRLQPGEVLVTHMTSPDWVPLMRRASAVVTDAGGMTSHAAIVSRELGIPCVVGTREATRRLRTGDEVTVDGREGTVVHGRVVTEAPAAPAAAPPAGRSHVAGVVTATRIYVNLGEPDIAARVAATDVDGVGLLRAEFLMLAALDGAHPRALVSAGKQDELVERLVASLRTIAAAFHPRPVVYRAIDFRSNEFRGLRGGEAAEPHEENPMIGYRGCFRYIREPDLFALELRALAEVRRELDNLHLMIPFVRTLWELRECLALVDRSPLGPDRTLQRWVMAEVPSVVYWLPEYARLGITGVSIGSNDLTQLVLGVDRDSELLSALYDERDPAVLDAVRAIVLGSRRAGILCSICGQAPSVHPEYAARLVRWGIDSISVNPDAVDATRRSVAAAERRVLLDDARRRAGEGADSTPATP